MAKARRESGENKRIRQQRSVGYQRSNERAVKASAYRRSGGENIQRKLVAKAASACAKRERKAASLKSESSESLAKGGGGNR